MSLAKLIDEKRKAKARAERNKKAKGCCTRFVGGESFFQAI